MADVWVRSSSADPGFTATVGAAPSVSSGGSYGERYVWAAQAGVSAYGYRTVSLLGLRCAGLRCSHPDAC